MMKSFLAVFSVSIAVAITLLWVQSACAVNTTDVADVAQKNPMKTAIRKEIDRGVAVVEKGYDRRKRIALVIGNSNYNSSPLKNPVNDARVMASTLRRLGFEVMEKTDLGYVEMNKAVETFGKKLRSGGVGLFYYAGHGMQVNGANYLIPVDARIEDENEVRYKAIDAGLVLAKMEQAKSDVNIVVLDACRDNPFSRSFRSSSHGLASMDAPSGTFIGYATAPGKTAADGDGKNGLYTAELVKVLETTGIALEQVFKRALKAVREKSGSKQTPWVASNLEGEFYFVPLTIGQLESSSRPSRLVDPPRATNDEVSTDEPATDEPATDDPTTDDPTSDAPDEPAIRDTYTDSTTGMEFINVPSGCFQMDNNEECVSNFNIGKFEVTQGQWYRVMGNKPSKFSECGYHCPVERVSWNDVQEFIQKLNVQSGRNYRLPTLIEWEYACRSGGKSDKYCGGNDVEDVAWYKNNSGETTHEVGTKQPNNFGIYDMSGNVMEWTMDGSSTGKVTPGGSWANDNVLTQAVAKGLRLDIKARNDRVGFRLLEIPE